MKEYIMGGMRKVEPLRFVIQQHYRDGERPHWDLMLERDGILETYRLALPPEKWEKEAIEAYHLCLLSLSAASQGKKAAQSKQCQCSWFWHKMYIIACVWVGKANDCYRHTIEAISCKFTKPTRAWLSIRVGIINKIVTMNS